MILTTGPNDDPNWSNWYLRIPLLMVFVICIIISVVYGKYYILLFILVPFIGISIILLNNKIRLLKIKKSKKKGLGISKLVKVTGIKTRFTRKWWYAYGGWYYKYGIEARDGNMVYYSGAYNKGNIGGVPRERMEEIYRKYGFEFDENETYKQDVLEEIDKRIGELQYEIESNEGYFKNQITKYTLYTDKKEKNTVETGYQPAYWEVNGHRITVGDTVTVYIDPENPKYYWMDIDFLFEK